MNRLHIILDLDETCISSAEVARNSPPPPDSPLEKFQLFYEDSLNYIVHKRPHLDTFLDACFSLGKVSFWSAGDRDYVIDIIHNIVPQEKRAGIGLVLWREHCVLSNKETGILKSLMWLQRKIPNLAQVMGGETLLVDDLEENVMYNGNLAHKIPAFHYNSPEAPTDTELLKLVERIRSYFSAGGF